MSHHIKVRAAGWNLVWQKKQEKKNQEKALGRSLWVAEWAVSDTTKLSWSHFGWIHQTCSHIRLLLPVHKLFGMFGCGQNHWLPKSTIKTQHLFFFFSSKRSKTHHSECESSHQWPQLFYFHNVPPQKCILCRFHPLPLTDRESNCPYLVTIKLYPALSGEFLPACLVTVTGYGGVKMSQPLLLLHPGKTSSHWWLNHMLTSWQECTHSHSFYESSRQCAPTRNNSESLSDNLPCKKQKICDHWGETRQIFSIY